MRKVLHADSCGTSIKRSSMGGEALICGLVRVHFGWANEPSTKEGRSRPNNDEDKDLAIGAGS